jgi:hypothetical protein
MYASRVCGKTLCDHHFQNLKLREKKYFDNKPPKAGRCRHCHGTDPAGFDQGWAEPPNLVYCSFNLELKRQSALKRFHVFMQFYTIYVDPLLKASSSSITNRHLSVLSLLSVIIVTVWAIIRFPTCKREKECPLCAGLRQNCNCVVQLLPI